MERKRKRQPVVASAARTVLAEGVEISNLTPAQSLTGGELFPIVQNNETRHATVEQIKALIPEGEPGKPGKPGESAYDIWVKAQPPGTDVSEAAYLEYQHGGDGEDGDDGDPGQSAYAFWAASQPEGADTSGDAYLAFQQGGDGEPGKSAYQTWLDAGHKGSEEDFLKWLQVSASVSVDPLSSNILKNNTDGLYVNGAHPIIPKFSFKSLTGLLNNPYSLADGAVIYTLNIDLPNPLNIASLGGVSLYRDFSFEPEYYYYDEQNSYVHYQIFVSGSKVTAESVALTIKVIMSGAPKRAFSLSSGEEITVIDGQDIRFPVSVHMLIGTSLEQNNMG